MKICLVCSHGGHFAEMQQLVAAFEHHDVFLISYNEPTVRGADTSFLRKAYFIEIGNRDVLQLNSFFQLVIHLTRVALQGLKILLKEKPRVIVTTGSEIAIPICYIGRMFGCAVVFVESLSRVNDLSRTGRIIYPIANLFLVQWQHLAMKYRRAHYRGRVL